MSNKPKGKWNDIQIAIATISMTTVLAFWNMFAGPDKEKADQKIKEQSQALLIPTITQTVLAPSPMPTVPPIGYTILFGGTAPQPQVIVQSSSGGNNKGNNNKEGNGGAPVTSTGSS